MLIDIYSDDILQKETDIQCLILIILMHVQEMI